MWIIAKKNRTGEGGLNNILPNIHVHSETQNMTLFGMEVLADVIEIRMEMRSSQIRVNPNPITVSL